MMFQTQRLCVFHFQMQTPLPQCFRHSLCLAQCFRQPLFTLMFQTHRLCMFHFQTQPPLPQRVRYSLCLPQSFKQPTYLNVSDTASVYRNEEEIGKSLQSLLPQHGLRRQDIFITSKLGRLYSVATIETPVSESTCSGL